MKKKRDGFAVTVDARKVWVVLTRRIHGGPYHARFWHDNKQYWRATDCMNYETARVIAQDKVAEVLGASKDSLTLRDAIDRCVAARWPTPDTYNDHRKITLLNLNSFAAHTGDDTNLKTLNFEAAVKRVQAYLDFRRNSESAPKPRTILNEQRKLSRLFAWLIKRREVSWTSNPASVKFLELPKVPEVMRPPVSPKELVKLLKAAKKSTIWPSVLLCLTTGLRPIGTLRITWSDVNFETARLRVFEKNKERLVPLNAWVLGELKAWKEKSDSEYVVDLKDRSIHYWMNKIRTEQKLRPEATLQGCRRTFISMAMDRGVSAELVASIAGNSVPVIEKHYKDLRTMNTEQVAECFDLSGLLAEEGVAGKKAANRSKIRSKKQTSILQVITQ